MPVSVYATSFVAVIGDANRRAPRSHDPLAPHATDCDATVAQQSIMGPLSRPLDEDGGGSASGLDDEHRDEHHLDTRRAAGLWQRRPVNLTFGR
jgi:hypothetical protein